MKAVQNEEEILQELLAWIRGHVAPDTDEASLAADTEVIRGGLLDSLSVMSMVNWIEDRYGFEIQEDQFHIENFRTPGVMAAFVSRQLNINDQAKL